MFKKGVYLLLFSCGFFSCQNNNESSGLNKFSDPVIRSIYEFKDRRLSDSLYQYFIHENPVYRNEAALAFGSIQDSLALDQLSRMLMREKDSTVRKSIAFSIGQTRSQHSERILLGALMREKDPETLRELLEAYGKTTSHWQLIHPSFLEDTTKAQGLAWSIYRAGFKGKTDSTANRIARKLIHQKHHSSTQLAAAHYYSKSAKDFGTCLPEIISIAENDPSVDVRMAATHAIGKMNSPTCFEALVRICDKEKDGRVKINALKALQNFPFEKTKTMLYEALYDKDVNVAIAASEVIQAVAQNSSWIELSNLTERISNYRVQANLYAAALKNSNNKALIAEIKNLYNSSRNDYQKSALLFALQSQLSEFKFVEGELRSEQNSPVIKTTASYVLAQMNYLKDFGKENKIAYSKLCESVMPVSDMAVIGNLSSPLADSTLNYRSIVSDHKFLLASKTKLTLPQDNEAAQPLEQAIAYFEKRKSLPVKNNFNNPIDWKLVEEIRRDQQVIVKTTRGNITMRLLVEDAPGSVSNFVKLAKKNYFDQKFFHRVVPNFVIQTGCNRGDGWGGENYSIRSEFSHRRYTTGSVGMASAGKDTEGTQWFITHSPTPHLDGRYTIFAEVISGMNVVNLIEVGDQILDVELVKN